MSTTEELLEVQQKLTQNALEIAESFERTLDFSLDSINTVESVLAELHDFFVETGADDGYNGIALSLGASIITVIEKHFQHGTWRRDHEEIGEETFPYEWSGKTLFPYGWCLNRLYDGPADNVASKFTALVVDHQD